MLSCPADVYTLRHSQAAGRSTGHFDEHGRGFVGKKDSKKKKDAQLVLRLHKETRDRFVEVCQELDTTAAREVRRFIKRFLKRYDKGEIDE